MRKLASIITFTLLSSQVMAQAGDIQSLSWLAGRWCDKELQEGAYEEEFWTSPSGGGGIMLGVHRTVIAVKDRKPFFEYLRIEQDHESLTYYASPRGQTTTAFRLSEIGHHSVQFSNPAHDFPQHIRYWLDNQGFLHAKISGKQQDKTKQFEWIWRKIDSLTSICSH